MCDLNRPLLIPRTRHIPSPFTRGMNSWSFGAAVATEVTLLHRKYQNMCFGETGDSCINGDFFFFTG